MQLQLDRQNISEISYARDFLHTKYNRTESLVLVYMVNLRRFSDLFVCRFPGLYTQFLHKYYHCWLLYK